MMTEQDSFEKVVGPVVESLHASQETYRTAARNAVSRELRRFFQSQVEQRDDFVTELEAAAPDDGPQEVETMGPDAGVLPTLARGMTTIRAAMTIEQEDTDNILLADCLETDSELLQRYREALSEDPPQHLETRLASQYDHVQTTRAYMDVAMGQPEKPLIMGLFRKWEDVDLAVSWLEEQGFDRDRLGVLAQEPVVREATGEEKLQSARESGGAGALGGGAVGGLIGLIAGASLAVASGVGSVLTAGILPAALGVTAAGAGIGAIFGAIFGTLLGWGVAEEDIQRYLEAVRQGEILISVKTEPERADQVAVILRKAHGHDVVARSELSGNPPDEGQSS